MSSRIVLTNDRFREQTLEIWSVNTRINFVQYFLVLPFEAQKGFKKMIRNNLIITSVHLI